MDLKKGHDVIKYYFSAAVSPKHVWILDMWEVKRPIPYLILQKAVQNSCAVALNLNHSYFSFKSLDQEICRAVCWATFPWDRLCFTARQGGKGTDLEMFSRTSLSFSNYLATNPSGYTKTKP